MNRINPLYLALLLVVVLLMLVFKVSNAKDELLEVKREYKSTLALVDELTALKKVYTDKNKVQKELKRVLNNSMMKNAQVQQHTTKRAMSLSSKSMDIKALNYLMGKILNSSYNITSLTIKKLSDEKVSLQMEITW